MNNIIDLNKALKAKPAKFLKEYVKDVCYIHRLLKKESSILFWLISNLDEHRSIHITRYTIQAACEELGISESTFRACIHSLAHCDLIEHVGKVKYKPCELFFSRDKIRAASERDTTLAIRIDYDKGVRVMTPHLKN